MELLILVSATLSLALVIFTYQYLRFLRRYQNLVEDNKRLTKDTDIELQKILQRAMSQGESVLAHAQTRAQELIAETKLFTSETQEKFSQYTKSLVEEEKTMYENLLEKTRREAQAVLQSVSEDIKKNSEEHMVQFVSQIESDLAEERQEARAKREQYQKEMYDKVDDAVYEIIKEVSQKVIGKSLSIAEHEKLVMDALQEAKHEHFIE